MKSYEEFIKDISTNGIPNKPFFTVVQLNNGHVYTIEANSTEELYNMVNKIEEDAKKEGLL
ncbi:hypothetical protein [Defluviitalea phaphyphila]|uniref:hypothetical protein n=1 Tax=Defluviitalea phaphyphila TaxID=1473580 RepID=UPI0007316F77|nr:hypothetical protein [Defluviitalea phaphyphila]